MALYKRGKIWWMSYAVEGRLRRKSTKMKTRKAAEQVWAEVVKALATGQYSEPRARMPHLFEVVAESYRQDRHRRGKREDSYTRLKDWEDVFRGQDVSEVTLERVEEQLGSWMADRGWSAATYNNVLSQLSGLLGHAYRKGWITHHPLRGRAERLETNNERERYFYPHELAAMARTAEALARLKGQPRAWLRDIIAAAAFTGLRRGVFCELRCRDVRRDEHGELWLRVARDKNGRPVEKRLVGEVADIVQSRLGAALPMAHLFPGPGGANAYTALDRWLPLVVKHVGRRHPDWGLRWGIKDGGVTFHSFRHAMASLALNAGVDRDVVKRMGNWKTDAMVNRYAHRADQHMREAEEKLADVLSLSARRRRQEVPSESRR